MNAARKESSPSADNSRKFRPHYTKFGCRDYRGAHCVLELNGRELLGEIVTMYRDETRGCVHARVRHMNGEAWPVEPVMSQLWILDRSAA